MTVLITNSRERGRFMRFAVVGLIGFVVDFGVMNILTNVFHTPFVLAGAASFAAAIVSNFTWNRYWTYPDSRTKSMRRQLVQFFLVSIIGLTIRVPLLALLEPAMVQFFESLHLNFAWVTAEDVAHNVTLAIAVIVVMFWNFFANRYWTYGDVES